MLSFLKRNPIIAVFLFLCCLSAARGELERFDDVELLDRPNNDGDSFWVELGGEAFHLRLYYVDCPEISAQMDSDARRVREQTRYWALPDPKRTVHFGHETKRYTRKMLKEPFTVHTAFASAMGRSAEGRIYAFVQTAEDQDLATLLVKNGLARVLGIGRKTPDGVPRDEMIERLWDLELMTVLKRIGIWEEAVPDLIPVLRRKEREEGEQLDALRKSLYPESPPAEPLDPNTASLMQLQTIPGIGPVFSERIVAGRPYKALEDLLQVAGIGPIRLERIREYTLDPEKWEVGAEEPENEQE